MKLLSEHLKRRGKAFPLLSDPDLFTQISVIFVELIFFFPLTENPPHAHEFFWQQCLSEEQRGQGWVKEPSPAEPLRKGKMCREQVPLCFSPSANSL